MTEPTPGPNDLIVRNATLEDRLPLARMLELYQHDLSDIWDQDLNSHGEYGYLLDRYWHAKDHYAFVATVGGKYAGFALVNRGIRIGPDGYWMEQFFVLKKYRRHKIGYLMAMAIFSALPGRWEVGELPLNHSAQAFWRNTIGQFTGGQYTEQHIDDGWWQRIIQIFESPLRTDA